VTTRYFRSVAVAERQIWQENVARVFLILIVASLLVACEDPLSKRDVKDIVEDGMPDNEEQPPEEPEEFEEPEEPAEPEEPEEPAEPECVEVTGIEPWTIRVVEGGCVIDSYTWDFDPNDYEAYDRVDVEYSEVRDYLRGWAMWHNLEHGTKYVVEYRRQ